MRVSKENYYLGIAATVAERTVRTIIVRMIKPIISTGYVGAPRGGAR